MPSAKEIKPNNRKPYTLILKRLTSIPETLRSEWNNSKWLLNLVFGVKLSKYYKISIL
jgi:hypothetical protein